MAMRKVFRKDMTLWRYSEVGYKEIQDETREQAGEGDRLHELGLKFESDKIKLEDEIEKVNALNISIADKRGILVRLRESIELLQKQYDESVTQEERRVQEEIQLNIEQMNEAAEELGNQADSLRSVSMDAAYGDADTAKAAESSEAEKLKFEQLKCEYTDKLKLQMEQAEIQRRNVLTKRLSKW